jgi:two-component system response regulator HydG
MKRTSANILIVDDDSHIIFSLRALLERYFTQIFTEKSPDRIPSLLHKKQIDVVILDMNYAYGETSGREGMKWIKRITESDPNLSIVPITAYGGVDMAVEALKAGAVDFVVKPWQNEKIVSTINAANNYTRSKRKISVLKAQKAFLNRTSGTSSFDFIGKSDAMKKVFEKIDRVADTVANVLILGENGTGKELVARSIHNRSERNSETFVTVDLGSISESLFESELFGYVKGAFTDAATDRLGRFDAANEGTLFLDEIGNIPLVMQTKLLSALQNREIFKVGSTKAIPIDIRLIAATNQNIYTLVNEGAFRNDLFYRINTVEILLPPLRNRAEDVPLIGDFYIQKYSNKYRKQINPLSEKVIQHLRKYEWPGNVRELQHAIERAVILCSNKDLRIQDFQFRQSMTETQALQFDNFNLNMIEKWAVENCLDKYQGHVTKAAEELGITRGALYRRFDKHEIKKY